MFRPDEMGAGDWKESMEKLTGVMHRIRMSPSLFIINESKERTKESKKHEISK